MKKYFLSLFFLTACTFIKAQRIYRVAIFNDGKMGNISIASGNENVIINITADGIIAEWGTEYRSERITDFTRLEKYLGRTDYYIASDDVALRGKVKYIGNTPITYYASYENELFRGKVKTIGTLQINYYQPYEDALVKGKIQKIGSTELAYFTSFDNEALRGKLRQIGITALNYYPSFEDKAIKGRIKSIGSFSYTYYSSFDRQYAGALKTGAQSVFANGINFYLKY